MQTVTSDEFIEELEVEIDYLNMVIDMLQDRCEGAGLSGDISAERLEVYLRRTQVIN